MRFGVLLVLVGTVLVSKSSAAEITVEAMRRASAGADMTAAIQAVINSVDKTAAWTKTGGVLKFAPGEYLVGSLRMGRNITRIEGYGATLKTKPYAGEGNRIFKMDWDSNVDSPLVTVEGLTFNMNHLNQGWDGGHDLSHQAAIFLTGKTHNNRIGRLNVLIKNCLFINSVADGVYVHHQVNLKMQQCIARDCFRAGLVITGHKSEVDVYDFTSTTNTNLRTGIDIEPNSVNDTVKVRLNHIRTNNSTLDLGVTPSSTLIATNINSSGPVLIFNKGTCQISDSTFNVNKEVKINWAGDTSLNNCRFVLTRNRLASPTGARTIMGVNIAWNRELLAHDQRVNFTNCQFLTDSTVLSTDNTIGIYGGADNAPLNNWLLASNCVFDGRLTTGVTHNAGGNWLLQNNYINATNAYALNWKTDFYFNVRMNGNTLGPKVKYYWYIYQDGSNNRVTHQNTILSSAQNRFSYVRGMYKISPNKYAGSRIINGVDNPTVRPTPGLPGDVYVQGQTTRWICTRGDYYQAGWARETTTATRTTATKTTSTEPNYLLETEPSATRSSKPLFGTGSE